MQPAVEGAIREHLAKVLTSAEFLNSERLCRFLRFVVDAKLRGEQDRVKEYLIGNEVFDRGEGYDPRLDPIVRVEARRLRKKLEAYYAGPGSTDAIRFDLPKGAYVPEILEPSQAAAADPGPVPVSLRKRSVRPWIWLACGLAALMAVAAIVHFRPKPASGPVVAVLPARWIWIGNDFPEIHYDEDLAERTGTNLASNRDFRIVSWPSLQRFRGTSTDPKRLATEFGVQLMILVAIRVESDGYRVTTFMIDPIGGRKLSVSDRRGAALETPADRAQAAAQLAETLRDKIRDFASPAAR